MTARHTAAPVEGEASPPRRRFLGWLTGAFLSLWGLGFAWVVAAFLRAPRSGGGLAERVLAVGPLAELPVGRARFVRHGREPIWVVRTAEDTLVGLSAVCTHLRCILDWSDEEEMLRCPCHEGAFDLNGNVLRGPPPRPLGRYRVEVQLGQIYVYLGPAAGGSA